MIRIECYKSELEYIKNNIKDSILNKLFDLSIIDWNESEAFALTNLVKEACEIKRDNPNMTCDNIGKIMKLSRHTIRRYLIKGSKIWDWINYDAKEEKIKTLSKNGKLLGKPVQILKNDIIVGEFESVSELSKQSESKLGVKLNYGSISLCCRNKQKIYQGFTFKYIDKDNITPIPISYLPLPTSETELAITTIAS